MKQSVSRELFLTTKSLYFPIFYITIIWFSYFFFCWSSLKTFQIPVLMQVKRQVILLCIHKINYDDDDDLHKIKDVPHRTSQKDQLEEKGSKTTLWWNSKIILKWIQQFLFKNKFGLNSNQYKEEQNQQEWQKRTNTNQNKVI